MVAGVLLVVRWLSDSEAGVYVEFVSGVGVEVVGGLAVELVALAKLASDEEAESDGAEAGGDPAYGLDQGALFRFALVFVALVALIMLIAGEGQGASDVFCVSVAGFGAKDHDLDDSSGASLLDETAVLLRCSFCVIGSWTANISKGFSFNSR